MPYWFFTSDLHGQGALYEQVVSLTAAQRPRAVLIGGDLAPHATGDEGVQRQRVFLQGFLVEFARRLLEASPETRLLLMMGNDDWGANADCLDQQDGALWAVLHDRAVRVDGVRVAGLSWVPITPFTLKDWERWEDGAEEAPPRLDGWVSVNGGVQPRLHRAPSAAAGPERAHPRVPAGLERVARRDRPHRGGESGAVRHLATVRGVVRPGADRGNPRTHGVQVGAAAADTTAASRASRAGKASPRTAGLAHRMLHCTCGPRASPKPLPRGFP